MKTTPRSAFFALLVLMSPGLMNCASSKCEEQVSADNRYYAEQQNKSRIPYASGFETLTYTSDAGDTIRLKGTGPKTVFNTASKKGYKNDCPVENLYRFEWIDYEFRDASAEIGSLVYRLAGGGGTDDDAKKNDVDLIYLFAYGKDRMAGGQVNFASVLNDSLAYTTQVQIGAVSYKGVGTGSFIFNNKIGILRFTDPATSKVWTLLL